jgi:hypothetical protein
MATDHIRYDLLTQQALRGVVRTVLTDVAKKGLPGDHHFYISFDTKAEGLRLSPRMRAQYPEEMTIVLQHQFWDLAVTEEAFEVGLSFGGISERLLIPFEAVRGFVDPSVEFGLRFELATEGEEQPGRPRIVAGNDATKTAAPEATDALPAGSAAAASDGGEPGSEAKPKSGTEPDKPTGGGEVVRLDRFRKK